MGVLEPDVYHVESTAHYYISVQGIDDSGKMAEALGKRALATPQPPAAGKKPRSDAKQNSDKKRSRTRVNIGTAFHRWRLLMDEKKMKFDSELATFLLDR